MSAATDLTQVTKKREKAKKEIRKWSLCDEKVKILFKFEKGSGVYANTESVLLIAFPQLGSYAKHYILPGFSYAYVGNCSTDTRYRAGTEGVIYIVLLYHSFGRRAIIVAMSPLILSFLVSFFMLWLRLYLFLFSDLVR